jgi:ribose/xylose/arabinose/galactoside ABC-type transport system permease subunit
MTMTTQGKSEVARSGIFRRGLTGLPASAYVLVVLIVLLAAVAPGFLSLDNLSNVGRTAAVLALAACGQAIVIITRGIDLSSASAVALLSVVTVLVLDYGTLAAVFAGVLVVLAVGSVNGLLVARFDVPPFLVTLGMFTGLHGLASLLAGGIPVEAPPDAAFAWFGNGRLGPVPVPTVLAAGGFVVLALVLSRTVLGRSWYLIGASPSAARAAGIRVRRSLFAAYLSGAAFVAVAGVVLTSRVQSGQPNLAPNLAFEAIAACAIGGLPLTGGEGSAARVLLGVLIVALIGNGLRLLNFSSDVQLMAIGLLTVVAVVAQKGVRGKPKDGR